MGGDDDNDNNPRGVWRRLEAYCETWTCALTTIVVDEPVQLLAALREAGCDIWIDREDDTLYVSPPARRVDWASDVEESLEEFY